MKIAIDIDNCINNLNECTVQIYNEKYNTNLTQEAFKDYDVYKCLPFEDAEKYCAIWDDETVWNTISPVKGSQAAIKRLIANGHDVYLVTATDPYGFAYKSNWLNYYYPFVGLNKIVRIVDRSLLNVDVLIDDCVENLISNILCYRVCYDMPWNRLVHDEVYGIYRCNNWEEIINVIKDINNEIASN